MIMSNPLGQFQNVMSGIGLSMPYGSPYPDKRTDREKLNDLLKSNEGIIMELELKNKEIKEALAELDKHPHIEKLNNLIRKLVR